MIYMIIITLLAGIINEIIQVAWVHHAEQGNAVKAAGVTGVMCATGLLGMYSIVTAVQDKSAGIPIVAAWLIGSSVGTYIGVRFAKSGKKNKKEQE